MLLLADRQTQGLGLDDITGKVLLTSSLTTSQNQTAFVSKTKKLTAAHAPVNSNSLHRHRREREREREGGGRTDGHTDRKTDRQTCSHSTVHWQILAAMPVVLQSPGLRVKLIEALSTSIKPSHQPPLCKLAVCCTAVNSLFGALSPRSCKLTGARGGASS